MNMDSLKNQIKLKAKEFGFEKVGVARAMATNKEKDRLNTWIKKVFMPRCNG